MSRRSSFFEGYEKIKTVGKGSFGTATLYKRNIDGLLVVMKDVFLTDMTQVERRLALNEVQVLSSLNHPNIIRYISSFEKEGSLIIVMEYADGGNLAQMITSRREKKHPFPEPEILDIFSQICSGISYMHSYKILHRDMKSANIFLNKNGSIKIGDFGISKMLDTRSQAQTVVGTPYYLSPEMCEGKDYNEKSDIWAMGCILYELTCLRKPFEAPTLPLLVQKITVCDFPSIPDTFSDGLFHLIEMILQRESEKRPSSDYIQDVIIPSIRKEIGGYSRKFSISSIFNKSVSKERSVLYELFGFTSDANLYPVQLPNKKIIYFSNSSTHFSVATEDKKIYTWGEDSYGQLGHGSSESFRKYPICVDVLRGKKISKCFAGDSYSIFLTETGIVLSCGDGRYGCLGQGDWNNVLKPRIVESLINVKIVEISCGSKHVLALASNGRVYSWGSAKEGQLGLGHTQYCCKPMPLKINDYNIEKLYTGLDSSALLTTSGKVLLTGNNRYSKLGFRNAQFLKTFLLLDDVFEKIKEISLGVKHTVLLTVNGNVLCMGSNEDGQSSARYIPNTLISVVNINKVQYISAGLTYTVAGTEDNVIYFWGSYSKASTYEELKAECSANSNIELLYEDCDQQLETKFSGLKFEGYKLEEAHVTVMENYPKPILALYASAERIKNGNILWLAGLSANENSVSVLVHTTAPLPPKNNDNLDSHSKVLNSNWTSDKKTAKNELGLLNTPQIT